MRDSQGKIIIKNHPTVIGVTLDIPVHSWSSGLISPIISSFATSTVADIHCLRTLSCWTQGISLELSLQGTVVPEEAKMEMRSRFRSMPKRTEVFPKFLCPDEPIWANCSLQTVPMEQGGQSGGCQGCSCAREGSFHEPELPELPSPHCSTGHNEALLALPVQIHTPDIDTSLGEGFQCGFQGPTQNQAGTLCAG